MSHDDNNKTRHVNRKPLSGPLKNVVNFLLSWMSVPAVQRCPYSKCDTVKWVSFKRHKLCGRGRISHARKERFSESSVFNLCVLFISQNSQPNVSLIFGFNCVFEFSVPMWDPYGDAARNNVCTLFALQLICFGTAFIYSGHKKTHIRWILSSFVWVQFSLVWFNVWFRLQWM